MSATRFIMFAVGLFGLAFILFSWAQKGFPVMALRYELPRPDPRIATFEQSAAKGARENWEKSKTNQSDGDGERDKLRLALMQAATAYRLSPCDLTMKENLVEAATNYVVAWHSIRFCKPGVDGCPRTEDERGDTAKAAFHTPADLRVHDEVRQAYAQGGVDTEDFPVALRKYTFLFGRPASWGKKAACHTAGAENRL